MQRLSHPELATGPVRRILVGRWKRPLDEDPAAAHTAARDCYDRIEPFGRPFGEGPCTGSQAFRARKRSDFTEP
jgi:hypothetical protein